MLAWIVLPWYVSLGLIIVYGLAAGFAFDESSTLRRNGFALLGYLLGLTVLFHLFALSVRAGGASGFGGIANLIFLLFGVLITVAANGRALWTVGDSLLSGLIGGLTGSAEVGIRKTYDKAEAARERGDLEAAAELYREEPEDTEARRRLADVLLEMGRTEEAVGELRAMLKRLEDERPYCATAFRLAEVLEDGLGDRAGAEQVYRDILARYPRGEYAQYARARLGEAD
ncbi:MAG: tetratricopeptide repeat protein [Candidatus Brocadiia bacterium]